MQLFMVKEYLAGYVTIYLVIAENESSVIHKMKKTKYFNKSAKYEFSTIDMNQEVLRIVEVDVW
jgi:hypothetical protein